MQHKWKSWLCKKNVKNDEMKGKIGKWEGSGKNCTEGRESSKKSEEREGIWYERETSARRSVENAPLF